MDKMVDFLVLIQDDKLLQWHAENAANHPEDYPILGRVTLFQTKMYNESVYYVPDVQIDGRRIKYGVVGLETLLRDLYTWNSMFLAGRLHKPTLMDEIDCCDWIKQAIHRAMESNYDAALRTAVLLTGSEDFRSILKGIVSLSYTNDPRLLLAESPRKIENILTGQLEELESIYLERWEEFKRRDGAKLWDPLERMRILSGLPCALKSEISLLNGSLWSAALKNDPINLSNAIGRIVRRSAWNQMLLGSISTPPLKAFSYVMNKMKKRFQ